VGLLVTLIWREVKPREGILSADGLYTVRADADLRLEYVTQARTVQAGDVLARFRSPERRAEMTELELKRHILETQRDIVELQPLTRDADLVRQYERCVADQRQLIASLNYLVPERALIVREKLRDALDKTERIKALNTRIEDARRELQQAVARAALAEKHVSRLEHLALDGAAAGIELDERSTRHSVSSTQVQRLETAINNMELERRHLQESLPAFAGCTSRQAEEIDGQISGIREQLTSTRRELEQQSERLDRDLQRAGRLKARMLAQLDLEIRQCQAKLEGIQDVLTIKAPFQGIIAFADTAPAAALPMAPVVILAPDPASPGLTGSAGATAAPPHPSNTQRPDVVQGGVGFRFRLRMSESEAAHLSEAGTVRLGLVAPVLQRRFPGRFLQCRPLSEEPGYVLAELACMPPAETIRDLAAQTWHSHDWALTPTVRVRLLWQPPIYASPLFFAAVGLLTVGLIGFCSAGLRKYKRTGPAETLMSESGTPAKPRHPASRFSRRRSPVEGRLGIETEERAASEAASAARTGIPADLIAPLPATGLIGAAGDVDSGAVGRNLQLLGQRLRESIVRQEIEPALVRALEWAIDRHHARAIRCLAAGLDHDSELPARLAKLQEAAQALSPPDSPGQNPGPEKLAQRVIQIVRTVAPELLPQAEGRHKRSSAGVSSQAGWTEPDFSFPAREAKSIGRQEL